MSLEKIRLKYSNVVLDNIIITDPKPDRLDPSKLVSYVNYKNESGRNDQFTIQTPYLVSNKGISGFKDSKDKTISCTLNTGNRESVEDLQIFEALMRGIDEKVFEFCVKHCEKLFKKKVTKEQRKMLEGLKLFNPVVKTSVKNGKTYVNARFKVKEADVNKHNIMLFKEGSNTELPYESFKEIEEYFPIELAYVRLILRLQIAFVNQSVYLTYVVDQVQKGNKKEAMLNILSPADLDINNIVITPPVIGDDKTVTAFIRLNKNGNNERFVIQTPYCGNRFGITQYNENSDYSLQVSLSYGGRDEPQEHFEKLQQFIGGLDEKILDYIIEHSKTIFDLEYSQEDKSFLDGTQYKRKLREYTNPEGKVYYSIELKVKSKMDSQEPNLKLIVDESVTEVPDFAALQELVQKNTPVKLQISFRLIFLNGKVYLSLKPEIIEINKKPQQSTNSKSYGFSDEYELDAPQEQQVDEEPVINEEAYNSEAEEVEVDQDYDV